MRMVATICAGISKNMPGLSFAAAISSGNYWPNGKRAPVGNVLIWTSEDNLRDTIKPRLVQMGADLSRIDAVTQQFDGKGKLRPFNRQPICRHLRKRPDARREEWLSFMIDPIVAAIPLTRNSALVASAGAGEQRHLMRRGIEDGGVGEAIPA